ncbi:MAG: DNA recombination protein RmuC [Rickettsiales bacterium]|nr:DNA recombination protein RmuC [Rickettsiales bacterium]
MVITLIVISLVLVATTIFFYNSNRNLQSLNAKNLISDERAKNFATQLQEQSKKFEFLFEENRDLSSFKGRYEHAQNEINFLREEKNKMLSELDLLRQKILEFEKQNELLKQSSQELKNQKEEWGKDKEALLSKLSEELIRKNNEQQNLFNTNQQEHLKKITSDLMKDFENVSVKIATLNDDVKKSVNDNSLIKNALLSPGSAGRTAEITLENILKNSGLKEKDNFNAVGDYLLQSHFNAINHGNDNENKRPDVILFLPNNQVTVIDSKSSPHFLELEQARLDGNLEQEKIILGKIKDSFRRHLESLCKKDYTKFLFEELRSKEQLDYKIHVLMFLQTEKMLEILREADHGFEQRALEKGVIIATPIGLINFLSQARFVIDRLKQDKNIENLKIEIRKLLDNVVMIFKESGELGKSINKAMIGYNKLAKNLNRTVALSKNISDLGIEGKKSANLKMLETHELDGETEE